MKILQINTTVNIGSTGRIAEDIGKVMIEHGHESYIAFGRGNPNSKSQLIKIGNNWDVYSHGLKTIISDRHGFGSKAATKTLIERIEKIKPDVIGLHNLHGYYLNIETLFKYIKDKGFPIIWSLHDCWVFTGHCAHFDYVGCEKWKTHCHKCPLTSRYPSSYGLDNSKRNFLDKKRIFNGVNNLTIVTPSQWLANNVAQSFLSSYPVQVIHNGIDLEVFKSLDEIKKEKLILGVASVWDRIKGLDQFIELRKVLSEDYKIVLIGLTDYQIKNLPKGIKGLSRTENMEELVQWYNRASFFVNPTLVDNFPTVNLEALACGTPVITYNTGGSPESIDVHTGRIVEKRDVMGLVKAIEEIEALDLNHVQKKCRERAENLFDKNKRFKDYLDLFERKVNAQNQRP